MIGKDINYAAKLLIDNQNVAIPTETVYGLAANALSDDAVANVYKIKQRPSFNPLIVHSYSIEELKKYVIFSKTAEVVAKQFWPGSLTLILPRKNNLISNIASCGLDTLAVRIPDHEMTLELLKLSKLPLCAPSANKSCQISPTSAQDVKDELGIQIPYVLDGGACSIGLESTVLSLVSNTPTILRHGVITKEMLETVLDQVDYHKDNDEKITAPGMMLKHYSPNINLTMNATQPIKDYAFIGFGSMNFEVTLNLSKTANLAEAASNLFKYMRILDDASLYKGILVSPIPNEGIGLAINDRLTRASNK